MSAYPPSRARPPGPIRFPDPVGSAAVHLILLCTVRSHEEDARLSALLDEAATAALRAADFNDDASGQPQTPGITR